MLIILMLALFILTTLTVTPIKNSLYCGLAGYSGPAVNPDKLRWLVHQNEKRGTDAVGIFSKNELVKEAISASDFLAYNDIDKMLIDSKLVLAHTRAATVHVNKKSNTTAHPFEKIHENFRVVGAHNGWLMDESIQAVKNEFDIKTPLVVDSEYIFEALARAKGDFTALSKIEGVMALLFCYPDVDPNTLYIYRRNSRPLHVGQIKDNLYMSSEEMPLWIVGCSTVWSIQTDTVYALNNGVIVDCIRIAPPKIKSLSETTTRAGWRVGLPKEEQTVFPEPRTQQMTRTTSGGRTGWTGATDGGEQYNLYDNPVKYNKRQQLAERASSASYSTLLWKSLEDELTDKLLLDATSISVLREQAPFNTLDSCRLLLRLESNSSRVPLPGYMVVVNETEVALTTPKGFASLDIDWLKIPEDGQIEVKIYDPLDLKESGYKAKIDVQEASVVEVTLQLPFRTGTEDGGETSTPSSKRSGDVNISRVELNDGTLLFISPLDNVGSSRDNCESNTCGSESREALEEVREQGQNQSSTSQTVREPVSKNSSRGFRSESTTSGVKIKAFMDIDKLKKLLLCPYMFNVMMSDAILVRKSHKFAMWEKWYKDAWDHDILVDRLFKDAGILYTYLINSKSLGYDAVNNRPYLPDILDYLIACVPQSYIRMFGKFKDSNAVFLIKDVNALKALQQIKPTETYMT